MILPTETKKEIKNIFKKGVLEHRVSTPNSMILSGKDLKFYHNFCLTVVKQELTSNYFLLSKESNFSSCYFTNDEDLIASIKENTKHLF